MGEHLAKVRFREKMVPSVGVLDSDLFFISRMTPRKMMMKRRMPAMDPAIFTVWSVCFSCSGSGFLVAVPADSN